MGESGQEGPHALQRSRVAAVLLLVVLFELRDMREKFFVVRPAREEKTNHLEGPLGRLSPGPNADQQTRNQGHIGLDRDPLLAMAQQVSAPEDALEPAEEKFDRPAVAISEGY